MFQETVDFVGSKLKQKGCNACPDMQRSVSQSLQLHSEKEQTAGRFQELKMSRTH